MKKKILIMDDEDMVGEIACQMLEFLGFDAFRVTNGAEAIQEYSKQKDAGKPYSAIIMDLTIPGGMGGGEAIGAILAIDPESKAFVSSGYANDPIMVHYQDYGFSGVIAKPFDIEAVREILKTLL
ncbi:MAG: response regulator [Proteobacteria bacterium]|nr:response regulator [Pseudomonadota bacterium]